MNTEEKDVVVTDAQVVPSNIDVINAQKANFTSQLEQVKKDMLSLQQQFDQKKILGTKLEGALESLELLLKNLPK